MSIKKLKYELLKDKGFKKYYKTYRLEYNIAIEVMCARIKQKLTQEQLAKKSKLLQSALARIETGNHLPNIKTLKKIAKGLKKELIISFK